MLPKSERLNTEEVEAVMSKGKSLFTDYFLVKFLNISRDLKKRVVTTYPLKISTIAPKKTFSTAVSRNKARRRAYSAIFSALKNQKITGKFLIVLVCNKKMLSERISAISAEIQQIFQKGGII